MLGWFDWFLRQFVSERRDLTVLSGGVIRDEYARKNSRGLNYLPSSGYAQLGRCNKLPNRLFNEKGAN